MIGQYFSAFLVGTTGGDFVKIFYVARAVPGRRVAVAFTVLVDRVVGLAALLLLGLTLSFLQLPLLLKPGPSRPFTTVFYVIAAGGLLAALGSCVAPFLLKSATIRKLVKRLPLGEHGNAMLDAFEKSARAFGTNVVALLGSIPTHLTIMLMGYCVLRAMHLEPSVFAFCCILVIVNILIAVPISINGAGVREQLFVLYFGLLSIQGVHGLTFIDSAKAVTFSITFFFLNVLWSLAGAPFYFLYRHEVHAAAPPITDEATHVLTK